MRRRLYEYHHALGGELEEDAENIANTAISIVNKYLEQGVSEQDIRDYINEHPLKFSQSGKLKRSHKLNKRYFIKSLDTNTTVYIAPDDILLTNSSVDVMLVAINRVMEAMESGDNQRLVSMIYHELGHATNIVKSDRRDSEIIPDFKKPMFLYLDDSEYKHLHKLLYRFHTREMKARCFETKMFLKKNRNKNITIKDVYDDRCSDITLMRELIDILKTGARQGPDSKEGKILNDISRDTWEQHADNIQYGNKIRWKKKCENTIRYFVRRLEWFKKRIDKIYYDYITTTRKANTWRQMQIPFD